MTHLERVVAAYTTAIYFTDTGDLEQPSTDAELSPYDKAKCYLDCRAFVWAVEDVEGFYDLDAEQVGHDIWLTRNGHGVGFWDRPEVYGENYMWYSRVAKAMGPHDVTFEEETV